MVSLHPPVCDFGWKARDFNLLCRWHTIRWTVRAAKRSLVMFICNLLCEIIANALCATRWSLAIRH
jgi:hypothetical protein